MFWEYSIIRRPNLPGIKVPAAFAGQQVVEKVMRERVGSAATKRTRVQTFDFMRDEKSIMPS